MGKGNCGKQKKKEKSERKSSFAFVGVPCLLASVGPPLSPRGIALTKATALNNGNLDSQNPGLWATNWNHLLYTFSVFRNFLCFTVINLKSVFFILPIKKHCEQIRTINKAFRIIPGSVEVWLCFPLQCIIGVLQAGLLGLVWGWVGLGWQKGLTSSSKKQSFGHRTHTAGSSLVPLYPRGRWVKSSTMIEKKNSFSTQNQTLLISAFPHCCKIGSYIWYA